MLDEQQCWAYGVVCCIDWMFVAQYKRIENSLKIVISVVVYLFRIKYVIYILDVHAIVAPSLVVYNAYECAMVILDFVNTVNVSKEINLLGTLWRIYFESLFDRLFQAENGEWSKLSVNLQ